MSRITNQDWVFSADKYVGARRHGSGDLFKMQRCLQDGLLCFLLHPPDCDRRMLQLLPDQCVLSGRE